VSRPTSVVSQGFLYIVVQASGLRLVQAGSPHHKEFHCKTDVGTLHYWISSCAWLSKGAGKEIFKRSAIF